MSFVNPGELCCFFARKILFDSNISELKNHKKVAVLSANLPFIVLAVQSETSTKTIDILLLSQKHFGWTLSSEYDLYKIKELYETRRHSNFADY